MCASWEAVVNTWEVFVLVGHFAFGPNDDRWIPVLLQTSGTSFQFYRLSAQSVWRAYDDFVERQLTIIRDRAEELALRQMFREMDGARFGDGF